MNLIEFLNLKIWKNYIKLKVRANSVKTEFDSIMEDWTYKLKVKAIREKWKANNEIIRFLSKELKLNKDKINILSWETSNTKLIMIEL